MFPRSLTLFRVAPAHIPPSLETAFAEHLCREPGPLEMSTRGFVSPFPGGDSRMTISDHGNCTGFVVAIHERILPGAAVSAEAKKRCQKIVDQEGRRPSGRERKRIRDDVLTEMIKHAPVHVRRVLAWVDHVNGWVVVDTSSRRTAEQVVHQVREALGSFPAVALAPEESPRALLTDWLATGNLPAGFSLGEDCELRDPSTSHGSIVRCRRQDLEAEEVREHLRSGKQAFHLGIEFDQRTGFVLSEQLGVTKLRFFDVVLDQVGKQYESPDAELQGRFALAALEVARLLRHLEEVFTIPVPEA